MKWLILLVLFACSEKPIETSQTDNPEIPVSLLFTHDGCKVYRFSDSGNFRYFTNCSEVSWSETNQCGKSRCTYHHSVKNTTR